MPLPAGRRARMGGGEDGRLRAYLSGSVETIRPVRLDRRMNRNRAVVIGVFLAVLLFWALARFL